MHDDTRQPRASGAAEEPRPAGYYMEYPTLDEVRGYIRELDFDERFTVLSQGFHRGVSTIRCYSIEDFVMALGKREYDNPAGGVRKLDREETVSWLRGVIGDTELARAADAIFDDCETEAEAIDTLRIVVYVRMNQYNEVLRDSETA